VPLEVVAEVNRLATDGLVPDLTLVLDLAVVEGLRRVRQRGQASAGPGGPRRALPRPDPIDPFEQLGVEFHERVRKGYRALHEREPTRVELIDAAGSEEAVAAAIRAVVRARFGLPETA
jgi:dTMP kinase